MAQHVVSQRQLGIAQTSREVFDCLADARLIEPTMSEALKKMVGFRNIAVHGYQRVHLPIIVAIIENKLDTLLEFSRIMLR